MKKDISIPRIGNKRLHRILCDDMFDGQTINVPGSILVLTSCCWHGEDSIVVAVNENHSPRKIKIKAISFRVAFENYPEEALSLNGYKYLSSTSSCIYFYKTISIKNQI